MTDDSSSRRLLVETPERDERERRFRKDLAEAERLLPLLEQGGLTAVEKVARRIKGAALVEALLARSWALRHEDPREMVQYAWLAVQAATTLDARRYGAENVIDLRCRATAELGNAYRVADSFDRAEDAMVMAVKLYELGTGDPDLGTRLLDLQASLFADRRRFGLASEALAMVYEYHRQRGNDHLAGRALLSRGLYAGYSGAAEEGIRLLEQGLELVDEAQEPGLVFTGVHNLLVLLIDSGLYKEAKRTLFLNRKHYGAAGGELNLLRVDWVEAKIDAGLGSLARAEETLARVKEGFERAGRGYDAALVALDLAAALQRLDRHAQAEELVLKAVPVFTALHVHREAIGALLFLRKAFELRKASPSLVEDVAAFLRRAEHDPEARFEPRPR